MNPAEANLRRLQAELKVPMEYVATFEAGPCGPPRHRKSREAAKMRAMLAWRLRHDPRWPQPSYPEIALAIGWRSHSTAVDAVAAHQARLDAQRTKKPQP